jgi:hypothetical protein
VAVPLLLDGNQCLDYLELERRYKRAKQLAVSYLVERYGGQLLQGVERGERLDWADRSAICLPAIGCERRRGGVQRLG